MPRTRYVISGVTANLGEVKGWSIIDTEHPLIRYPFFNTKAEAYAYLSGMYGLTVEEYKKLNERKRTRTKQTKVTRIKNDKLQGEK